VVPHFLSSKNNDFQLIKTCHEKFEKFLVSDLCPKLKNFQNMFLSAGSNCFDERNGFQQFSEGLEQAEAVF
jgi:hypothetical protein